MGNWILKIILHFLWVHLFNISRQVMDFHFSMSVMEENRGRVCPLFMHLWDLEKVPHSLSYLDFLLRENCTNFFFEFSAPVSIGEHATTWGSGSWWLQFPNKIAVISASAVGECKEFITIIFKPRKYSCDRICACDFGVYVGTRNHIKKKVF